MHRALFSFYFFFPTQFFEQTYNNLSHISQNITHIGRRGAVARAPDYRTRGPGFESSLCHWFDVRKGVRSMKRYIAPVQSPFGGGTVRAQIKMGEGDVNSNPKKEKDKYG